MKKRKELMIMKKERMGFRKFFAVLLMMIMVLELAIPGSVEVYAASSKKSATVTVGKTITLRVNKPSQKVKWSVNKPKIAQITKTTGDKKSTATIKGKKAGKAVVTATIGKKKQRVTVTVKAKKVVQRHVHSYTTPATCTEPAKCTCGLTYGAPLGHQMSPATCQTPQTCIRCGATEGGVVSHNYDKVSHRCIWCNQLNVKDFVVFAIENTSNTGNYNVNFVKLYVLNQGLVSFEIITRESMPSIIYPGGGTAGIRVYLTDKDDLTYTDANRFVVLPGELNDNAFFDTLNLNQKFTFMPGGVLEFYANYGEHIYLFRVNASGVDASGTILDADYTFTQIN